MTGATGPGQETNSTGQETNSTGQETDNPGQETDNPGQRTGSPGRGGGAGGSEPDPRFTFANERTFLAWSRTALAVVVAGLGVVQLLPPFPGVPWGRHLIGVPLIVLGAVVAVAGYGDWVRNQRALRRNEPIPKSVLPVILTVTITAIALLSAAVLLLSATR